MSSNKIKITDYMKLSREVRQKHIDLSVECQFYYYEKNRGKKKMGDIYSVRQQMIKAKNILLEFLNIEDFIGNKIYVCHLCDCCSTSDKVCINPLHLYFGTASENTSDIPIEIRQKTRSKGGKVQIENKTHNMLKIVNCIYCDKQGNLINMKRWHFDNCKYKSI